MRSEPARWVAAVTAAVTATVGLAVWVGWLPEDAEGPVTLALAAWIALAGELVRARVTPVDGDVS